MIFVATVFDEKLWDLHGVTWCRTVKSHGYTGVILDRGIPQEARDKADQLKFQIVPVEKKYGSIWDAFAAFVPQIKAGDSWIFLRTPSIKISQDIASSDVLTCRVTKNEVDVSGLAALHERVKYAALLADKTNYTAEIIGGGFYGWNSFLGFYDFLVATQLLDASGDASAFVLNLFSIYFPDLVQQGGDIREDQP